MILLRMKLISVQLQNIEIVLYMEINCLLLMQIAQEGLSYSSDNINWVIADYNPSRTLSRMIFINNLFFGTISNNSIYNISYDGINWNDYNYSTSEYWLALIG